MNASAPTTQPPANAAAPTVPAEALRPLPVWAAGTTLLVGIVSVAVWRFAGDATWAGGLLAAFVIAALSAAASVAVLKQAAGRAVDWLVTLTMGATVVRMGVSGIGVLVAAKGLNTRADVAGLWICVYYAAMLVVETTLMTRVVKPTAPKAAAKGVGGLDA